MKTIMRSVAWAGVLAIGALGLGTPKAQAQAFGFSYASPGFGISVGNGGPLLSAGRSIPPTQSSRPR